MKLTYIFSLMDDTGQNGRSPLRTGTLENEKCCKVNSIPKWNSIEKAQKMTFGPTKNFEPLGLKFMDPGGR